MQSNLYAGEWKPLKNLTSDRNILIKDAYKGTLLVVWDRADYILEAEKHLNDKRVYKELKFNENILTNLVEKSNKVFNRLRSHKLISESELKYFTYNFKKETNLGKRYFLPKIHKRLANVQEVSFISTCCTPIEKASEYLDFLLQQGGWWLVVAGWLVLYKRYWRLP